MNETVPTRGFSILPVSCYVFINGCYIGCTSGILRVGSSYGILRGILRVYFGVYFWSGVAMGTAAQKHACWSWGHLLEQYIAHSARNSFGGFC